MRAKLLRGLLVLMVLYGLLELTAYLLFEPLTQVSLASTTPDFKAIKATKAGRARAGLGFKDPKMSLHPYLGYVYTPPSPKALQKVPISKHGFLDVKGAIQKRSADRLLIGIVGGSVAGQLGTWHFKQFKEKLTAHLKREVELVRLGMPGYHQPQQVIQLSYILAQGGEFDLLLNIDGFNEIAVPAALNTPRGAHPLFPMNWSMVALDTPDPEVRRNIGAIEYMQSERAALLELQQRMFGGKTIFARLVFELQNQRLEKQIAQRAWWLQTFQHQEIPFFISGPKEDHAPTQGLIPASVKVWKRCSLQLLALSQAQGIRYYHFLQPNQYDPGKKRLSKQEKKTAFDLDSPYRPVVETGYPALRDAGERLIKAGVSFHDLSGLFKDVSQTVYSDNCCHYNAFGNALLSEAIAKAIAP